MQNWLNPNYLTVLIPKTKIHLWNGIGLQNDDGDDDFSLVSKIPDFCGLIQKPGFKVIAFTDEPTDLIWIENQLGKYLLRWLYAHNGEDLVNRSEGVISSALPVSFIFLNHRNPVLEVYILRCFSGAHRPT